METGLNNSRVAVEQDTKESVLVDTYKSMIYLAHINKRLKYFLKATLTEQTKPDTLTCLTSNRTFNIQPEIIKRLKQID